MLETCVPVSVTPPLASRNPASLTDTTDLPGKNKRTASRKPFRTTAASRRHGSPRRGGLCSLSPPHTSVARKAGRDTSHTECGMSQRLLVMERPGPVGSPGRPPRWLPGARPRHKAPSLLRRTPRPPPWGARSPHHETSGSLAVLPGTTVAHTLLSSAASTPRPTTSITPNSLLTPQPSSPARRRPPGIGLRRVLQDAPRRSPDHLTPVWVRPHSRVLACMPHPQKGKTQNWSFPKGP